jgi:serine/threonine protein kinase
MQQELEVLANVNHPNIMRIYELLEDNVNYYVVTELLSGGELFDYIIKYKKFE